jgi:hypothetical protein
LTPDGSFTLVELGLLLSWERPWLGGLVA